MSEQILTIPDGGSTHRRFRLVHAEDPRRPGVALCGARLRRGTPTAAAAERCLVCLDLTHSFRRS